MQAQTVGPIRVALRAFLEQRQHGRFPIAQPCGDELCGQGRFSGSRRPGDEQAVALEQAPVHHLVQLGYACGKPQAPA